MLHDLTAFDEGLMQDCERRGRCVLFVILPPRHTEADGIYSFNIDTDTARHNHTEEECEFSETMKQEVTEPSKLVTYMNWSEQQAVLKVPGTTFKIKYSDLFRNQFTTNRNLPKNSEKLIKLQPSPFKIDDRPKLLADVKVLGSTMVDESKIVLGSPQR